MKLPVLAFFERSLRVETRSASMYWARAGLSAIILFALLPIRNLAQYGWYGAPGLRFFQQVVWINVLFISLAGLSYFASAICEEKEEMMLGLLRMTDLNPVSILLGKSTSRLIGAALFLLAQFPFTMLAVTLGGVSRLQVVAAYATLLAYLFLLSNLALLFSVIFRRTAAAAVVTGAFLFVFYVGPTLAGASLQNMAAAYQINLSRGGWAVVSWIVRSWRDASPFDRLGKIFQTGFSDSPVGYQVASNLVLGTLLFLLAWAVFDMCTREQKEDAPSRGLVFGRKSRRSSIPAGVVGARAITWKDFTFFAGGKWSALAKFVGVGLLIAAINWFAYVESNRRLSADLLGGSMIIVSLILTAGALVIDASRIFKIEARWKTLSAIMILPYSVPELAYRKVLGALYGVAPLLVYLILGVMLVPDRCAEFIGEILKEPRGLMFMLVAIVQYVFFLHLVAYLSLVIKRGALPLAIAIQYVGGTLFMGVFSAFAFGFGGVGGFEAIEFFAAGVGVVLTVVLHRAIGQRLQRVAAEE